MSTPVVDPELTARDAYMRLLVKSEGREEHQRLSGEARSTLRVFMRLAWGVVEPARPMVANWHMDALADHLQAVADGSIRQLVISIAPGHSKSLVSSVLFPAWMWTRNPGWRGTFASYDKALSIRDSVRCRDLMLSTWYQDTFQIGWKLAYDQNEKSYYVNTAKGFRFATYVGGGTGWRGDCISCFTGETPITTTQGEIPIGRIVEERLGVKVRAFNHEDGSEWWQDIEEYECGDGRSAVRVHFSNGEHFDCTDDHPVFLLGQGYERAVEIVPWMQPRVISLGTLEEVEPTPEPQGIIVTPPGCQPELRVVTELRPDLFWWDRKSKHTNKRVRVVDIERIDTPSKVYNLRVSGHHNYFANGILVHNCDDALAIGDQFSDTALEEAIFWWDQVMSSRLNDMQTGSKILIMQRLHERDLAGHVLSKGGYEHLCLPTEYDPKRSKVTSIGFRDPRTEHGELLFPQMFPASVIEQAKIDMGPDGFSSQHQQSPSPAGGGIIKEWQWMYWKPRGAILPDIPVTLPSGNIEMRKAVDLPDSFDEILQSWDMSFKDLKTSDYVAGGVGGIKGPQRFLLDAMHDRMDLPKAVEAVRVLSGRWPQAHRKLIEDKANGPAVIQSLQHELSGLIAVNPEGGKVARARAATPELAAGNWYLPHPAMAPWVLAFISECSKFPVGAHDDYVDMWSQMSRHMREVKNDRIFNFTEEEIRTEAGVPDHWPRVFGLCIGWAEIAAVWMARNPETRQTILYHEYSTPPADPALHVGMLRAPGEWIPGVMSVYEAGRAKQDGYAVAEKYRNMGLRLDAAPDTNEAGVIDVQEALRSGKLKIRVEMGRWFDQFRNFRRDEYGKLPDQNCGLMFATIAAWQWGRDRMKQPPEAKQLEPWEVRSRAQMNRGGGSGWML